jgi:hypothetical protein
LFDNLAKLGIKSTWKIVLSKDVKCGERRNFVFLWRTKFPLRRHNTATLAGYMLINFLALAIYLQLKKSQIELYLEEARIILRQIKKKVYEDSSILTELTKEQKEILKAFNLIVPK